MMEVQAQSIGHSSSESFQSNTEKGYILLCFSFEHYDTVAMKQLFFTFSLFYLSLRSARNEKKKWEKKSPQYLFLKLLNCRSSV